MILSLDDNPLSQSEKILVQVMTEEKPFGFETDGNKITKLGGAPFMIKNIEGEIAFNHLMGADKTKIIALNENGYRTDKKVIFTKNRKKLEIILSKDIIYYILKRGTKEP